jgi:hypothetical protein
MAVAHEEVYVPLAKVERYLTDTMGTIPEAEHSFNPADPRDVFRRQTNARD